MLNEDGEKAIQAVLISEPLLHLVREWIKALSTGIDGDDTVRNSHFASLFMLLKQSTRFVYHW